MHTYMYIHIYLYIYIEREREDLVAVRAEKELRDEETAHRERDEVRSYRKRVSIQNFLAMKFLRSTIFIGNCIAFVQKTSLPESFKSKLFSCKINPTPDTRHLAHCTLHPAVCALHHTPYTLHPTPYTPHPDPHTLHPTPYTRFCNPKRNRNLAPKLGSQNTQAPNREPQANRIPETSKLSFFLLINTSAFCRGTQMRSFFL